ncbi:MAG: DUF1385 domain-containing protein [Actinomycetota bacterium]
MGRPGSAPTDHSYGGQALLEGVMMRGRDAWAVAVRRPDGGIHTESHDIDSVVRRVPWLRLPFLRGVIALGQSLAIGFRALSVSARVITPEDEAPASWQVGVSMAIAIALFLGLFIVAPAAAFRWVATRVESSILVNVLEGFARVGLFLVYLLALGRSRDVRRTFQYHGAEHQTISAYEHGEPLEPAAIGRFPTLHVRCGTNFLILVMIITILVFAAFGNPGLWWRIGSRLVAIPLIAGIAYELLRIGARFPDSALVRAIMLPGLWLQRITTRTPEPDQVEVAMTAFRTLLAHEGERAGGASPATA